MLLHVVLPTGATVTLRDLDASTTLADFLAELELLTGFADGIASLTFNRKDLPTTADQSIFSHGVHSGAVLRLVEKADISDVISAVCEQDPTAVLKSCLCADVSDDKSNIGKSFIAACICVNLGLRATVNQLMTAEPRVLSSRTVHGRNLLHFAVAADQPVIFFELLVVSPDPDLASCEDNFGKSAADLASDPNLANCERALRQFAYAKRTGALRELAGSRASTVAQQTDVTKTTSVKKPRAASAQVRLATREKSFASLAESELTSKSSYRYSDRRTVSSGYHTEEDLSKSPELFTKDSARPSESHISQNQTPLEMRDEYERLQKEQQERLRRLQQEIEQHHAVTSQRSLTEKREKRVKFQKRIKSAPNGDKTNSRDRKSVERLSVRQKAHQACGAGKPFMAFRSVPEEELRPLAVEYVELPRQNSVGLAQKERERRVQSLMREKSVGEPSGTPVAMSPRLPMRESSFLEDDGRSDVTSPSQHSHLLRFKSSSFAGSELARGNSSWSIASQKSTTSDTQLKSMDKQTLAQRKRQAFQKYTDPSVLSQGTSDAKSYYKAQYHIRREEEIRNQKIPPPRPPEADARFRAWKTWLDEKYDPERRQEEAEKMKQQEQKRIHSDYAFNMWKKTKQQSGQFSQEKDEDSGSSTSEEQKTYSSEWEKKYFDAFDPHNNDLTYERWLKMKQDKFQDMDKKTRMRKLGQTSEPTRSEKKKRIKNIEYGVVSDRALPEDDYDSYQHSFHKWQRRKKNYEAWKERQGLESQQQPVSEQVVRDYRRTLTLSGFSHSEWLGLKEKEEQLQKQKAELASKKSVTFSIGVK